MLLLGQCPLRQCCSAFGQLLAMMLCGQHGLRQCQIAFAQLLATMLCGKRFLRCLRSAFSRLLAALLQGQRFLHHCCSAFGQFLAALLHGQRILRVLLVILVGQSICLRCSCLSMLLLRERRARAAVRLLSQTCKNGLALLSLQSLVGKPDMEAVAAKP
jgi:hypothetical protein